LRGEEKKKVLGNFTQILKKKAPIHDELSEHLIGKVSLEPSSLRDFGG
jgi:hypothetical protein